MGLRTDQGTKLLYRRLSLELASCLTLYLAGVPWEKGEDPLSSPSLGVLSVQMAELQLRVVLDSWRALGTCQWWFRQSVESEGHFTLDKHAYCSLEGPEGPSTPNKPKREIGDLPN